MFKSFFKFLERWEYSNSSSFWLFVFTFYFCLTTVFTNLPNSNNNQSQAEIVVEQIRCGAADDSRNFLKMHRYLEKHFPDLTERMEYQEKQEKLYESAMKKKREIKKIRMLENSNLFTNEELDAIDYFEGTRKYAKHQDPTTKPNIFDTRQSFLLKIHDEKLRNDFLNSHNHNNNNN